MDFRMKKTRVKIKKQSGCARLSSIVGSLGRINIVFNGDPDGKNNYEYSKYKSILKGVLI